MSLILLGLTVSIMPLPFWYTIIRQMFYEEQHLTPSHLNTNPYVAYEGVNRTTQKQPHWPMGTMCVSVCVPWGPLCVCWVRGGRGFNKGTGLVQGCQSDCLGTCNLMGSRWEPPDRTSSSKPTAIGAWIMFHCLLPQASLLVYIGICGVNHQIKVTFSFNGTLKFFIDHRKMCYLMFQKNITCKHMLGSRWRPLFFCWSSNVNI